jgi:Swt1-like HEPN
MGSNAEVRKLLQEKLRIERATLYRLANAVANSLSIPVSDAILVLAIRSRVNLHKHGPKLTPEKLMEIRSLVGNLSATVAAPATQPVPVATQRAARSKPRTKIAEEADDPILSKKVFAEMQAMVPVYAMLYQFENSIRQFISRVLTEKHGKDWWDKLATSDLRKTYASHTRAEEINAWHQRRSAHHIDYLDLNQLPALVRAAQADFVPTYFKSEGWFQLVIEEVYASRCVVAHMNPLTQNNIDGLNFRFKSWKTLLKAKKVGTLPQPAEPNEPIQPESPTTTQPVT